MDNSILVKLLGIFCIFVFYQIVISWSHLNYMSDMRLTLESEIYSLQRKKDDLQRKILDLERQRHRLKLKAEKFDIRVRELLPLTKNRLNLPMIFFITPTGRRPTQKADLIRLSQTLSRIANLCWIVVEDAIEISPFISEILSNSKLATAHLIAQTPPNKKLKETDSNWKMPRGVLQRNTALEWIRTNFAGLTNGVVYFGDDDNTYDWKLFDEMRTISRIGVWPVGIVGGLLAETPILDDNLSICGFNAIWKPSRPFPIDMAGFAINISLITANHQALFTYGSRRGYQESDFLRLFNFTTADLEPKAQLCSKVYVWHTRTEKTKLNAEISERFWSRSNLTGLDLDSVQ